MNAFEWPEEAVYRSGRFQVPGCGGYPLLGDADVILTKNGVKWFVLIWQDLEYSLRLIIISYYILLSRGWNTALAYIETIGFRFYLTSPDSNFLYLSYIITMGWFDNDSQAQEYQQAVDNGHHAKISHELIAGLS